MANGKWQNSNGLRFADFQFLNHLPFDLCHLPFELFVVFTFKHRPFARSAFRGRYPSPVALRLMKTPGREPSPQGRGLLVHFGPLASKQTIWDACQALLGRIVLGMRGANGLGAGLQFSGRRAPLHLTKKTSVVLKNRGHVRVLGTKAFSRIASARW